MRHFNDIRLLPKFITLFVMVGVLPIVVVGWIARQQASSALETEARAGVAEVAFNASDTIDRNLFERYGDVQAFALSEPATSMRPARIEDWMNQMMGIYTPIYRLMVVADADGKIIAANTVDLAGAPLDTSKLLGQDVSGADWFIGATNGSLAPGQTLVQDVHHDALMGSVFASDDLAMSFTYPIRDAAGSIVGVWTNRFNWGVTVGMLDSVIERAATEGKNTVRLTVVNSDGVVVASQDPGETLVRDVSDQAVIQRALASEDGGHLRGGDLSPQARDALLGYYTSHGFETYPGVGWGIIASQESGEALSSVSSFTRLLLVVGALVAIAVALLGFVLARLLRGPVVAVMERLQSVTENDAAALEAGIKAVEAGDLTIAVRSTTERIPDPGTDELGQAGRSINTLLDRFGSTVESYNSMRHGLGRIVQGVRSNADSIVQNSDLLKLASDQMAEGAGQIAAAINEVSEAATSLAAVSQQSSQAVERLAAGSDQAAANAAANAQAAAASRSEAAEMGNRISAVAGMSDDVARSADESRSAAEDGEGAVQRAVESMDSIAEAVRRAAVTIDELGGYGQQIGEIVKTIDEIANQTNLLALNAAIEAARAGEQGRGFAVVADNVRSLAERSGQSAKEIADLISKVQSSTADAVRAMATGVSDVESGREVVGEVGNALRSIMQVVSDSTRQMQRIATDVRGLGAAAARIVDSAESMSRMAEQSADGARAMASGTSKVTEAVLQVSATSEQTSASAEEVSASTEELSAQSEELAVTAAQMKQLADELTASVSRFRIERETAPSAIASAPAREKVA